MRNYICCIPVFIFQGGKVDVVDPSSDPILQPVRLTDSCDSYDNDSETTSMTSDVTDISMPGVGSIPSIGYTMATPEPQPNMTQPNFPQSMPRVESSGSDLGGVWHYRQNEDDISIEDDISLDDPDQEGAAIERPDVSVFSRLRESDAGTEDSQSMQSTETDEGAAKEEGVWLNSAKTQLEQDRALVKV